MPRKLTAVRAKPGMPNRLQPLLNFAHESAARALQTGDRNRLVAATRQLHALADREVSALHGRPEGRPACRKGCDSCCHRVVTASVPEVFAASDFVRGKFNEAQLEAFRERCRALEEANEGFWSLRAMNGTGACPFLEEGACSIYEARPLSCRALNASDPESCRKFYLEGKGAPSVACQDQASLGDLNLPVVNAMRNAGL